MDTFPGYQINNLRGRGVKPESSRPERHLLVRHKDAFVTVLGVERLDVKQIALSDRPPRFAAIVRAQKPMLAITEHDVGVPRVDAKDYVVWVRVEYPNIATELDPLLTTVLRDIHSL